jgi:hypothetical protein
VGFVLRGISRQELMVKGAGALHFVKVRIPQATLNRERCGQNAKQLWVFLGAKGALLTNIFNHTNKFMKRRSFIKSVAGTSLAFGSGIITAKAYNLQSWSTCLPDTSECGDASGMRFENNFPPGVDGDGSWCPATCVGVDRSGQTQSGEMWAKCEDGYGISVCQRGTYN